MSPAPRPPVSSESPTVCPSVVCTHNACTCDLRTYTTSYQLAFVSSRANGRTTTVQISLKLSHCSTVLTLYRGAHCLCLTLYKTAIDCSSQPIVTASEMLQSAKRWSRSTKQTPVHIDWLRYSIDKDYTVQWTVSTL